MVARAGDGDDPRPGVPRDLHRSGADTTGRGGDEHGFTSPHLGAVDQPFVGGAGADHKPCGVRKVDALGNSCGSVDPRGRDLSKAATQ